MLKTVDMQGTIRRRGAIIGGHARCRVAASPCFRARHLRQIERSGLSCLGVLFACRCDLPARARVRRGRGFFAPGVSAGSAHCGACRRPWLSNRAPLSALLYRLGEWLTNLCSAGAGLERVYRGGKWCLRFRAEILRHAMRCFLYRFAYNAARNPATPTSYLSAAHQVNPQLLAGDRSHTQLKS